MKAMHSFSRTCLFSSLFALVLSNASIAHAQETAFTTRVGFVNSERLFGEAKASLAAQNKLKQEFSARERQLVTQADNLKKAIDRFQQEAPKMAESKRGERQQQLMAQDADFQRKRQEFQEDLNNRKNEELMRFVDKANKAIERVATREKYDVIVQEAAYINDRIDITDKVLRELNAEK